MPEISNKKKPWNYHETPNISINTVFEYKQQLVARLMHYFTSASEVSSNVSPCVEDRRLHRQVSAPARVT